MTETVADTADDAAPASPSAPVTSGPRAGLLFALGLIWLAATAWAAHFEIGLDEQTPSVALSTAANALAAVVAASLVAGAAAGLFATSLVARRAAPAAEGSPVRRLVVGLASGLVLGAASAGLVFAGLGTTGEVTRVAVTVGIGAVLGSVTATLPRSVLAAGLAGTFGALVLSVAFGLLQPRLVDLFRASDTAGQAGATLTVAYVQALVCGALAGVLAFWSLRGHGSRAWPWYLLAGLTPGLALLVTEVLTRVGGAPLLDLVRSLSDADAAAIDVINFGRLRSGLLILFAGALTAMIAVGRTLRAAARPAPDDADADAAS